jgi:hypothetical protein
VYRFQYNPHLFAQLRHRAQQRFSKGVLDAAARSFGAVPPECDPILSAPQVSGGKIQRMSHWTTPP